MCSGETVGAVRGVEPDDAQSDVELNAALDDGLNTFYHGTLTVPNSGYGVRS